MKKLVYVLLSALLLCSLFSGCEKAKGEITPVTFLSRLEEAVQADPEKAETEFVGKQWQMTFPVQWVRDEKEACVELEGVQVAVSLPPEELSKLSQGRVVTVEGTAESLEPHFSDMELKFSATKIINDCYSASGEIKMIFYGEPVNQPGKMGLAIESRDILSDYVQLNVFLPEEEAEKYQTGDTITAEGTVIKPKFDQGGSVIPAAQASEKEVVLSMPEPRVLPSKD